MHYIKPNKVGALFYYVQYSDCVEMCYFVECQKDKVNSELLDSHPFLLKFPTIDGIVHEITKDSVDKSIFKIDIRRAFHNLRVDPADAIKFGMQRRQKRYIDIDW